MVVGSQSHLKEHPFGFSLLGAADKRIDGYLQKSLKMALSCIETRYPADGGSRPKEAQPPTPKKRECLIQGLNYGLAFEPCK